MRIIFLGAPGSGKGTQAQLIRQKYDIQKISIGDILRNAANKNIHLDIKTKKLMDKGDYIKDELVINLIKNYLANHNYQKGFILDGFPRTIPQAKAIKNINISIDYVFEFDISDEIIIERIIGRRIHIPSGRVYHIKFNPPKIENKDDITGEKLIIRPDDKEAVVRKRLIEYHKFTKPLIEYYRHESYITNVKYFKLNASFSIKKISKKLFKILG
ncbi:Adenylate kinase [Candidatus Arsenophonus lipoptenae]|uniref:Adenylate kinase n=1 Tax=Candidatus Arsenophonus lipoptenae TaxID=634113 RepID=A0A0X9VIY4_9GAMM|nr:adenylate kinase [Candidatus Arsenophonus lipoptenae]AMA64945.1 Adenylate kinase [Candidatus Arsenophonus lipoptenae]